MCSRTIANKLFSLFLVVALFVPAAAASANPYPLRPAVVPFPAPVRGAVETTTSFAQSTLDAAYPSLFLQADPPYARPGESLTVTVTLRNEGNVALEGAVVSVAIPGGLAITDRAGGDYDPRKGELTWDVPAVAPSEEVSFLFRGRVTGEAQGEGRLLLRASLQAAGAAPYLPAAGDLVLVGRPEDEAAGRRSPRRRAAC